MDRNSTRLLVAPALAGIILILTGALVTGSAQTPPPDSQAAPSETQQTQILTADQLTDLVAPIAYQTGSLPRCWSPRLIPSGRRSAVAPAKSYSPRNY
jgi:hypothetical protein